MKRCHKARRERVYTTWDPTFEAHASLEQVWNQIRKGGARYGQTPTNVEYTQALQRSLRDVGLPEAQLRDALGAAIRQRVNSGQSIPRVPGRLSQKRRPRIMDLHTLKREAKKLSRPSQLLRHKGAGSAVAWYYETPIQGVGFAIRRGNEVLLIRPNGKGGGSATTASAAPAGGVGLYVTPWVSLPPIEAVFLQGSNEIGDWLQQNNWDREWGYNDNFGDSVLVANYEAWWQSQHPFYTGEGFAILGGWHFVWPDDDWHDLINDELVMWTLTCEPWIEVWSRGGVCRVIERLS